MTTEENVVGIFATLIGTSPSALDATRPIRDLGVDSTELVEVIAKIEKAVGVSIPICDLKQMSTMREIALHVDEVCARR